ncbi:MAG: biopolymer transporter ExbD [Verrucomicrobiota bacterium]|jgi:biopolymer transport protein ExbD/biopolymer transport protein TolR
MRRFSQRNSLVTLSEINITPLLDLAFVLLIIFVITRPMLEGHVKMQLPSSALGQPSTVSRQDVRVVEINEDGQCSLAGKRLALRQLETELVDDYRQNPKLTVFIRADKRASWNAVFSVFEVCMRNHITQISPSYAPEASR